MSVATSLVRLPILAYRAVRPARLPVCRYVPTCSEFALEAIEEHGPARGVWLGMKRILRCAPWGGWGFDPVPPRTERSAGL